MEFVGIFIVGFIGAITPGPDILLVMHNTLKFGIYSAIRVLLGIATGWLLFLSIIYFGFIHLISASLIQILLSFCGGMYLLYLSYLLLKPSNHDELGNANSNDVDKAQNSPIIIQEIGQNDKDSQSPDTYLKGLIINLSNPKAILFFSTIIIPFIGKNLELSLVVLYASLVCGFLSVIFVIGVFRKRIDSNIFSIIDRICGILFVFFGFSLFYNAFAMI
ncbi:LysE family translocator [Helicobacter muridarum]|uniref:LysE family translocator n=1 Tax=Helicobacter muridarum TaxID=216 RepID=A0A099U0J2_9HELI|nr:LysE family translocator [Helicobacter muridarum]TLE01111.1 LysE family translocator [Helicobacter muridarum]STQ85976.1 putative LysE type translocator/threonine efflux protein [Helicobacter muridarum]